KLIKDANITTSSDASGTNRTVKIVAESTTGGTAIVTLTVTDPSNNKSQTAKFNVNVRPTRIINVSNNHPITIVDNSPADVYPSTVTVNNLVGPIQKVTATVNGFTHSFASDVGVLLMGPSGQKIVLMNNLASGRPGPTNINLTFDQSAVGPVPV